MLSEVMTMMRCYRVWFVDDSALLVDAESPKEARELARNLAKQQGGETEVERIECLDSEDAI
jgi:hypothetical protein